MRRRNTFLQEKTHTKINSKNNFRAEGALTFECQKRTLDTLVFICPGETLISEILPNLKYWWAAKECVHVAPDATIRSEVAPGMVSNDLMVIGRVRRGFTDRN